MAGPQPVSRRRIVTIGVAAVAVVLAVGAGLSILGRGAPEDDRSRDEKSATPRLQVSDGASGVVGEEAGMTVGFSRDEDGAVSAAVAYATASQRWLYFTSAEIERAVTSIATPAAAPTLAREVVADVDQARERLGTSPGRVWWLVRPLATAVQALDDARARVAVWVVTTLSAVEVAVPQTEWMTVTVDLEWTEGDWRVDAVRATPGPTPSTGPGDRPWDATAFDEALDGFTRLDGEPVR